LRTTKTTSIAEKKSTKDKIREIIKKPKEKFLTNAQEEYWDILGKNEITLCFGPSGTGKSHLAIKRAIDLLWDDDNKIENIIIARPAVTAGSDIGLLPGDLNSKMDPYVSPSFYLLNKIIGKESTDKLVELNIIKILPISYLRGWNIDNSILLVEEGQNCTPIEMKLILTRIGFNSKFFISGDLEQSDKYNDKTKSGLCDARNRLKDVKGIGIFEFNISDIVRNPLISEILSKY
jgi:phosphate starvation-inducible PhoH-like protein